MGQAWADIDMSQPQADTDMGEPRVDTDTSQPGADSYKCAATIGRARGCFFYNNLYQNVIGGGGVRSLR